MRGSQCVCVYLLNTSEILYPYLVFACVEACFAIASSFPTPLTYFSGIFTCCRRVVQRKLMPYVYMCVSVCVCVSATVHLCIFLSCISARERFLCHCANYTKTTTTTSGRTDNVCHHMQHSARSNPPLPPILPSPFLRSTALDTHTQHLCIYFCAEIVICMSWR